MQPDAVLETATRRRGRPVGADSAETRSRILDAARHVITQHGYQAATFQAIAIEAGVTRPSVHHYFASREQIFHVLADEGRAAFTAQCVAAVQDHDTLRTQVAALMAVLCEAEQTHRPQVAFLVVARMERLRNTELNTWSDAGLDRLLKGIVRDAVDRGELPAGIAVEAVADMLQSLIWGLGFYAGFIDVAADMTPIHTLLDRALSHGLLAAARPRSAPTRAGDTPKGVVAQP